MSIPPTFGVLIMTKISIEYIISIDKSRRHEKSIAIELSYVGGFPLKEASEHCFL
jgi:hypothetical protein